MLANKSRELRKIRVRIRSTITNNRKRQKRDTNCHMRKWEEIKSWLWNLLILFKGETIELLSGGGGGGGGGGGWWADFWSSRIFFRAIWWAGYFFPFFPTSFLLHLCCMQFFSSDKRLQEFFFQNHSPPTPSRVKWSAPNIIKMI